MSDKEVCPYCYEDNEGYVKMFGRFYLRKDHFNGWNLYAGKGKPLPIKFCPICGRKLVKEPMQVNGIQDDFCGVPCDFMQNIINGQKEEISRLQTENKSLKTENAIIQKQALMENKTTATAIKAEHEQHQRTAEYIKRLKEENERLQQQIDDIQQVDITSQGLTSIKAVKYKVK